MAKQFKGFTEDHMKRIAQKLGYSGPMSKFNDYLKSNPGAAARVAGLAEKAKMKFAEGGLVGSKLENLSDFSQYVTPMPYAEWNPPVTGPETGDVKNGPKMSAPAATSVPSNASAASTPVTQPTQPVPSAYTPTYQYATQTTPSGDASIKDVASARMSTPGLPVGGTTIAQSTAVEPGQFIDPTAAQVAGTVASGTAQTQTAQAQAPTAIPTATTTAATVTPQVSQVAEETQAATGQVSQEMQAAQVQPTATQVGTVPAAQLAEATTVDAPASRTLQSGELVQGVADANKAAQFVEQVGAANANPTTAATVQGQLSNLMQDFEGGETPAWAAGALRNATAQMAARGLGASSMAGQALVQAAMEASLPIAQADAQVQAQFELTNLSNNQARAMLAAEQRAQFMGMEFDQEFQARVANASKISDIANMNFNAEQQIALENARMAQTVDLQNLSNQQAMVMAEAAQISNLETANLNNRQQAAVQNAQSFLQMDMANLTNEQQTEMFKAQSRIQSLMSDQAAENASRQFNASSENQTNQFFSNLQSQIAQFNAGQTNAQNQFNAEQSNIVGRFNAELQNQREQFNASNQLVIEQSNAQWRRNIATADTAAVNAANQTNAQAILNISNLAYSNLWQEYRDTLEWAWTSTENERQRASNIAQAKITADATKYGADAKEDSANSAAWGNFVFKMIEDW